MSVPASCVISYHILPCLVLSYHILSLLVLRVFVVILFIGMRMYFAALVDRYPNVTVLHTEDRKS